MINIDLTIEQVEELKSFYKKELDKILKRADELKGILEKFATKQESNANPKVRALKTEIQPKTEKRIIVTPPKVTGKQSKWSDMILELLKEKQKPLSIKEIVTFFEKQINIPKADIKKAFIAIQQSLYRLRTHNKKIQSIKKAGKSGKFYGLTEWAQKPETILLAPKVPKAPKSPKPKKIKLSAPKQIISKTIAKPAKKQPQTIFNWPEFVQETLSKTKRILTAQEFLKHAMKYYNIPENKKSNTRGKLAPALSRLEKTNKTLKSTKKKGVIGRSYGLSEWFDGNGNLKPEYK